MTTMDSRLETAEKEALAFANALRIRDNAPTVATLQPGARRNTVKCPIATTTGWEIGGRDAIKVGPRGGVRAVVRLPEVVLDFIAFFDSGMYPNLEVREREAVAA